MKTETWKYAPTHSSLQIEKKKKKNRVNIHSTGESHTDFKLHDGK